MVLGITPLLELHYEFIINDSYLNDNYLLKKDMIFNRKNYSFLCFTNAYICDADPAYGGCLCLTESYVCSWCTPPVHAHSYGYDDHHRDGVCVDK